MKPIFITVKSLQRNRSGEDMVIDVDSVGEYYRRNGKDYYLYEETEASGMAGTKTAIKVDSAANTVSLNRKGAIKMHLFFEEGAEQPFTISIPEGAMEILLKTDTVKIDLEDGLGTVHFSYDTGINGEWELYNEVTITIQEEQK